MGSGVGAKDSDIGRGIAGLTTTDVWTSVDMSNVSNGLFAHLCLAKLIWNGPYYPKVFKANMLEYLPIRDTTDGIN